jgi:hypothetical protein
MYSQSVFYRCFSVAIITKKWQTYVLVLLLQILSPSGFLPARSHSFLSKCSSTALTVSSSASDDKRFEDARKKQEEFMEAVSLSGADKIAKMNVSERTKRAMLAEAIENRIFQLQDDLDQLCGGVVPDDETIKSQCVEIARNMRESQLQYNDLVTGEPSMVMTTLESLATTSKTDKGRNAD